MGTRLVTLKASSTAGLFRCLLVVERFGEPEFGAAGAGGLGQYAGEGEAHALEKA